MKYFIDTEYDWTANMGRIIPISIGIIAEDGRELYLIRFQEEGEEWSPFVADHVWPIRHELRGIRMSSAKSDLLALHIRNFIGDDTPEFWGDYSAFDYVVLSMIMGEFSDWPSGWPMHINDCQQAGIEVGPSEVNHHALSDARAIRDAISLVNPRSPSADGAAASGPR